MDAVKPPLVDCHLQYAHFYLMFTDDVAIKTGGSRSTPHVSSIMVIIGSATPVEQTSAHVTDSSSLLVFSRGWGLNDLPLRAWDEHCFIVRVLRAQKIIRPHPFRYSGGGTLLGIGPSPCH